VAGGPAAAVSRVELFLPVDSSYIRISDLKIGDRVVEDMYPDISEKRPEGLLRGVPIRVEKHMAYPPESD